MHSDMALSKLVMGGKLLLQDRMGVVAGPRLTVVRAFVDNDRFKYGKAAKLSANKFKRNGYAFKGWAKSKKGKVVYKNKAKVKNLTDKNGKTVTLYAVWKKA